MFLKFIFRKLRYLINSKDAHSSNEIYNGNKNSDDEKIKEKLSENLNFIKEKFGESGDVKKLMLQFGPDNEMSAALIFIDGLIDNDVLTQAILRPLREWKPSKKEIPSEDELADVFMEKILCAGEIEKVSSLSELISGCLSGNTAIIIDGCLSGLVVNSKGWEKRGVSEPQSETVVRGPKEGFTENLRTNTALIRRKIKSPQLRMESLTIGRKTRTDICIMYLEGVASDETVKEVRYRISNLRVDSILESGYIEEYIEDAPFSPFPTVGNTEKPDVVAGRLLEGRIAVVVDGTPFVLTVPMLFIESFQTPEDYYTRPLYASMTRLIRYIGYFITVFAPAIYIALTSFHQELIPTTLLFTIANAREGTPFPVFFETALMVFAFEILREGGIRLPRPVGQAISIVGALIMGEAAVSAGIVGAPVVITIAITSVASFLVPPQNESASVLRLFLMILSAFAGLYGISMGCS